jgi:aspartate aminotransferase-like enzyme
MFGPNSSFVTHIQNNRSHRDLSTHQDMKTFKELFKKKFDLHSFEIITVFGPASLALQVVFNSLIKKPTIPYYEGKFTHRIKKFNSRNNRPISDEIAGVHFETSLSLLNNMDSVTIVDAVSSFPYYPLPDTTKIFVTCMNKQLGAPAGISIIGVRKDSFEDLFGKHDGFYNLLNIHCYLDTPSTYPDYLLPVYIDQLNNFSTQELRYRIDKVSECVTSAFNVKGEKKCPALSISKKDISNYLIEKYNLYSWSWNGLDMVQIFTYSNPVNFYEEFCNAI